MAQALITVNKFVFKKLYIIVSKKNPTEIKKSKNESMSRNGSS